MERARPEVRSDPLFFALWCCNYSVIRLAALRLHEICQQATVRNPPPCTRAGVRRSARPRQDVSQGSRSRAVLRQ